MLNSEIYDLIIIGGGPIGLACALEAQSNGLSYLILEKGCLVNSLYNYPVNMTFFSTSEKLEIGEIPFVTINPKPKRAESLEYYRRIQEKFALNISLFEEVTAVQKNEDLFTVQTIKSTYTASHVVIATGFYDLPNPLNIPGEQLPKVRHYYDDPHYYANQHVVVIGSSNSSVDAALETFRKGAKVTMVVRGNSISPRVKYWVRPDIENRIAEGSIAIHYNSCLSEVKPDTVSITTPDEKIELRNDFVLALTGYRPNFSFLKKSGVHIPEEFPCIPEHNTETMETNIKGLYLAGVVCGGLNTHLWFIENSRVHAKMIIHHLLKKA